MNEDFSGFDPKWYLNVKVLLDKSVNDSGDEQNADPYEQLNDDTNLKDLFKEMLMKESIVTI